MPPFGPNEVLKSPCVTRVEPGADPEMEDRGQRLNSLRFGSRHLFSDG
jgi:hypothetical protein